MDKPINYIWFLLFGFTQFYSMEVQPFSQYRINWNLTSFNQGVENFEWWETHTINDDEILQFNFYYPHQIAHTAVNGLVNSVAHLFCEQPGKGKAYTAVDSNVIRREMIEHDFYF